MKANHLNGGHDPHPTEQEILRRSIAHAMAVAVFTPAVGEVAFTVQLRNRAGNWIGGWHRETLETAIFEVLSSWLGEKPKKPRAGKPRRNTERKK